MSDSCGSPLPRTQSNNLQFSRSTHMASCVGHLCAPIRSHVTHPFSVSRGNIFVCLICVSILSSPFRSRTITSDNVIGCLRHRTLRCVSSSVDNIVLALNVLLVVAVGAPFYCTVSRPCPLIFGNLTASLLVPRVSSLFIHPGTPLIPRHCLDSFISMTVS